jgi:hypothetical protein
MRCSRVIFVALLGLAATGIAFATDPQPVSNTQANLAIDSKMILPVAVERERFTAGSEDHACFMMRTYRVRKDMDRQSVIPTTPNQASFNPDDIVGYSTCQRAGKFGVKTTE